jgi:short subunit dehydrogenase-like uncharacterized protein
LRIYRLTVVPRTRARRARNAAGRTATATLEIPEVYHFTALSAVESAVRVLDGKVQPGAWTSSRAFGADFVGELPGVVMGEVKVTGGAG